MSPSGEAGTATTAFPFAGTTADRLDVADAVSTFYRCADSGDIEGMSALLTEQVTVVRDGEAAELPRSQLTARLAAEVGEEVVQRLVAGHLVDVVGDTAVCTAQAMVVRVPASGELRAAGEVLRLELVRTVAGWSIARNEVSRRWSWRGSEEGVSS
jgi:hypothetical protein